MKPVTSHVTKTPTSRPPKTLPTTAAANVRCGTIGSSSSLASVALVVGDWLALVAPAEDVALVGSVVTVLIRRSSAVGSKYRESLSRIFERYGLMTGRSRSTGEAVRVIGALILDAAAVTAMIYFPRVLHARGQVLGSANVVLLARF